MCGDTACASCGVAQGHNPAAERAYDAFDLLLQSDDEEAQFTVVEFVDAIGERAPGWFVAACERMAGEVLRAHQAKNRLKPG